MRGLLVGGMAVALTACGGRKPAENVATPQEASVPATSGGGVVREDVTPTPSPTPAPTEAAIQEQPGPSGSRVALNRVKVTGDVMTVQLTYSGGKPTWDYVNVSGVSVIDDATSQKIGVLKDGEGKWLAAPMSGDTQVRAEIGQPSPSIVWFKFPAPPATSKTVSINIPEVGPFDGVPVTR